MVLFADHFSGHATDYAEFRPTYPRELISFLASVAPSRNLVWDCGTGSGQAAVLLANEFDRVVATDPSSAQLKKAREHPRIEYRVAPERDSGLPAASCDLVTAAQAAHWFDMPAFNLEADRVLRPRGVLGIWCYKATEVDPPISRLIAMFEHQRLGPYWPRGREHVNAGYRTLPFPYEQLDVPPFVMRILWSRDQLEGYVETWSAIRRFSEVEVGNPMDDFRRDLAPLWPDPSEIREVRWSLAVIAGRKPG
jgi:ubiquinone/menaquinone biosynthesis C-methylase UbiE